MSTYDSYEPRSNFGLYVFLGLVVAGLSGAGFYFFQTNDPEVPKDSLAQKLPVAQEEQTVNESIPKAEFDPFKPPTEALEKPKEDVQRDTSEETQATIPKKSEEIDPAILLQKIGSALEAANLEQATALIGETALTDQLQDLQALIDSKNFKMNRNQPVTEIGELEANRRARWALNGDGPSQPQIFFDLERSPAGKWSVESVQFPLGGGSIISRAVFIDSLGITDAFLQAALAQDFDNAKSFVDPELVSDAKIAGLCIIFEEAKYRLRSEKPLRAMFQRENTAGFVAHLEDELGEKAANFGLQVQRVSEDQAWRVTELSLESLLVDYAERLSGGDVHFTPLVKNPTGGDSLILYFGFDEDALTPRTEKQLDIVAGLLKVDAKKVLTLSGYTDSLGSDTYNKQLSARRAKAVEDYLIKVGLPREQIVTKALGASNPRLPNLTEDGEDNPLGRRANRRTEIYLDF